MEEQKGKIDQLSVSEIRTEVYDMSDCGFYTLHLFPLLKRTKDINDRAKLYQNT